MAMEIVEEARPVGQEPMLLEIPHRERKAVVDADQSRAEAPPPPPCRLFVGAEENQMGNSSEEPSFTDALGVTRFVFDASAKFASIME
jgi:hypothetical protein